MCTLLPDLDSSKKLIDCHSKVSSWVQMWRRDGSEFEQHWRRGMWFLNWHLEMRFVLPSNEMLPSKITCLYLFTGGGIYEPDDVDDSRILNPPQQSSTPSVLFFKMQPISSDIFSELMLHSSFICKPVAAVTVYAPIAFHKPQFHIILSLPSEDRCLPYHLIYTVSGFPCYKWK